MAKRKDNDEIIITALLNNTTNRAAAQAANISEAQIYDRLRNPEFKAKYDKARRELLDRNTAALQGKITAAIDVMAEIAENEENAPQIRLNAADAIIRNSLKLTEQNDIMRRLAALEGLYK